jgi:peptidoglycan/xylan/chitin deacetylase (PgdA/CDA1 family)
MLLLASPAVALEPIPDKLVVLTFDDSSKSHHSVARPILQKYKFGATFFITEGFDFPTNKKDYMTWAEIAELHKDGFAIGNHTLALKRAKLDAEMHVYATGGHGFGVKRDGPTANWTSVCTDWMRQ